MDIQLDTNIEPIVKNKPGPKAKPQGPDPVEALQDRVDSLEGLVIRMAHQMGLSHTIILDHDLKPFDPRKAMKRNGNSIQS
jgi:hypothetical protein